MLDSILNIINDSSWIAAFFMGLAGSSHCLAMCGSVHSSLAFNDQKVERQSSDQIIMSDAVIQDNQQSLGFSFGSLFKRYNDSSMRIVLTFSLGRITSYMLAGLVFGSVVFSLGVLSTTFAQAARFLSGFMLVVIALHIFGIKDVLKIEWLGAKLWRLFFPNIKKILPLRSSLHAYVAGFGWGWIPCGMVYSVLAWSALQAEPVQAALLMASFGLGTLPALLGASVIVKTLPQLINKRISKIIISSIMVILGAWTMMSNASFIMPMEESDKTIQDGNMDMEACH